MLNPPPKDLCPSAGICAHLPSFPQPRASRPEDPPHPCSFPVFSFLLLTLLTLTLPQPADAQSTTPPDQKQRQQRLLNTTSNIADDVTTLTAEFQRNGLGGDDVSVLEAIGTVLGSVSADEMPAIIASLTRADDENDRPQHLMAAYGGQKSVAIQLREVVLAYGRQVEIHELARRVRELGDRQSLNLHETVTLTFAGRKPNASRRQEEFQVTTQLIKSEQSSLRDEVENLNSRFSQLAVASMLSLENRAASASSFITASGVNADLDTATDEIDSRRPMSSTSFQRDSRDSLWQLANILVSDREPLEQLIAAIETLDRIIAGQTSVVAGISSLIDPETIPDRNGSLIQTIDITEKRIETLQRNQGDLSDRTTFLTATLRTPTPAVIPFLESALPPMRDSRLAFNQDDAVGYRRDTARPPAEEALKRLQQARELLLVAIEEFELTGDVPVDRLGDLRQLLQQTRELKAQQQALSETTAAPDALLEDSALDQAAITQRTEALERAAAAPSPEAARDIAEAAGHMQTSADALQKSKNLPTTQQAAVDALTRAEEILEEQIAALEEAAEQLAALEE
ncbi:MAG: hypothetical protein P8J87_04740, partial [Verrucomicrobiales bacterium]|nr:hypothetical protein [Verrucomicrobiales bacterium]